MTDPLDELASAGNHGHRGPAKRPLSHIPGPKTDKTPYVILISVGGLVALFMFLHVLGVFDRSEREAEPSPAPVAQAAPQPRPPVVTPPPQPHPKRAVAPATQPAARHPSTPPAEGIPVASTQPAGTIDATQALKIEGKIDEGGNLHITVRNTSSAIAKNVELEVMANVAENDIQTVKIPLIEPGKQVEVVVDYPSLRRRTDPKAVPQIELWSVDAE